MRKATSLVLLGVLLVACGGPAPTPDVSAIQTQAAKDAIATLTAQTPAATSTPTPEGPVAPSSEATPTPLSPTPTPSPATPTAAPTPTPLPPTPTAAPTPPAQVFSGHGQQFSPKFSLASGLTVFRMRHGGTSNFAIVLLDDMGTYLELLVNEIGPFDGAKAVGIHRAGSHVLDITADGDWTVSIEQPRPASAPSVPQAFTGHGQQVSPHFALKEGLATFTMTHDGASNFAIVLLNSQGDYLDLLVNEIGPFDGGKAVGIRQGGIHILDITADGNWTVVVEQ